MGNYRSKIMIVENEPTLSLVLRARFKFFGYKVLIATNVKQALDLFNKELPHLVIINTPLPKLKGHEVYFNIRKTSKIPIVLITTVTNIFNPLIELSSGIDYYVLKPFSPKELEAKIVEILSNGFSKKENSRVFYIGNLFVDLDKKVVLKNNRYLKLTFVEFVLLKLLIKNAGKNLSRSLILDCIWGYTPERVIDTRMVDVHISRLRSKIEENPMHPNLILTVRGVGYTFHLF